MNFNYPYFSISRIKSFLSEKNASPLKKWGQNFLIDPNTIDFIISSIQNHSAEKADTLIEIGPGLGALTHRLSEFGKPLLVYEIDPIYVSNLKEAEYIRQENLSIIEGDVLKTFSSTNNSIYLIGNLPYYITSDIIIHCLKSINSLSGMFFMVQKEFAERICKEISSLSIFASIFGKFEFVRTVSPGCFYPKPEASSALIKFTPHPEPICGLAKISTAELFLKSVFWGKRKTIQKSISDSPFLLSETSSEFDSIKANIITALNENNIPLSKRPEELTIQQFHTIIRFITSK